MNGTVNAVTVNGTTTVSSSTINVAVSETMITAWNGTALTSTGDRFECDVYASAEL